MHVNAEAAARYAESQLPEVSEKLAMPVLMEISMCARQTIAKAGLSVPWQYLAVPRHCWRESGTSV